MVKFKKGQKVRVLSNPGGNNVEIGKIYIVDQDESRYPWLIGEGELSGFKERCLHEDYMELVEEEKCEENQSEYAHKFKVGQQVEIKVGIGSLKKYENKFGTVIITEDEGVMDGKYTRCKISFNERSEWYNEMCGDKVYEEECEEKPNLECVDLYDIPFRTVRGVNYYGMSMFDELCNYKPINKKETFMNKVTSFVKNLTLTADEKLLRKHGLHDENGVTTNTAKEALLENFFNSPENQAFLLAIAQGLEAEAQTK